MDERTRRILERQQEREKKMREKELAKLQPKPKPPCPVPVVATSGMTPERLAQEKLLQEEEERRKEAQQKKNEEMQEWLEYSQERLHVEDRKIYGATSTGTFLKTSAEVRSEIEFESNAKTVGLPTGKTWIKTEFGWNRGSDPAVSYKPRPTRDFLPMWLYEKIGVSFGLHRPGAIDFTVAIKTLTIIAQSYMTIDTQQLNKSIMTDAHLAFRSIRSSQVELEPPIYELSLKLMSTLSSQLSKLIQQRSTLKLRPEKESTWHAKCTKWHMELSELLAACSNNANVVHDDISGCFSCLDDATIMNILEFFDRPKDLTCLALTCTRFSVLCSQDYLFKELLRVQFPVRFSKASAKIGPVNWKDQYIRAYRPGIHWLSYGICLCGCFDIYWAALQWKHRCPLGHKSVPKRVEPEQLVDTLLALPCPSGD